MKLTLSIIFVLFGLISIQANAKTPLFTDYPVKIYTDKKAPINYKSHEYATQYKTRIKNAYASTNVDFAGSYNITAWGCGSSCVNYAMIDRRTGKVYPLADLAYSARENARLKCSDLPAGLTITVSEFFTKPNS
ncbi:hypothetical protein [Moraxella boevrei]